MPPKMMAGLVYLWLSRLLPGVGVCFDFIGSSEKLSYTDHVGCMVRDHTQISYRSSYKGPLRSLPLHPPRGRAHRDPSPFPLSFSAGLKGSPSHHEASSFSALSLPLSTSNRPHVTPPASPFASHRNPTIELFSSAMNPEPSPPLRPLSVSSTLLSSLSSIDHPSSVLIIPWCRKIPWASSVTTGAPLTTTERRCFPPPRRLPIDDLIPASTVPMTLPGASPGFPRCSPATPCWNAGRFPVGPSCSHHD
jgi:hypothetical protein